MRLSIIATLRDRVVRARRGRRTAAFHAEILESRRLLSTVDANAFASLANIIVAPATGGAVATPVTNPTPTGTTPAQISTAYGLNKIVGATGAGETIAIIDAYGDPNIGADLKAFDKAFGLADPTLNVVSQTGSTTSLPVSDAGWALETSLDVEWAHAIAPGASILLVEASSASLSDLMTAVNYARTQPAVTTVSMSWGASDQYLGAAVENQFNSTFTTPVGHAGITFVASSGDNGGGQGADWPAASPNVLSVGGTTLALNSLGTYPTTTGAETVWSGSGYGVSYNSSEPSYQKSVVSAQGRSTPDVAYNASPNTGYAVYDSFTVSGQSGWFQIGGTSAGAPQWAGLVSLIDQARGAGKSLDGATQTLPGLYSAPSADFHQIAPASTGNGYGLGFNFGFGFGRHHQPPAPTPVTTQSYNQGTGLGTPVANALFATLVGTSHSAADLVTFVASNVFAGPFAAAASSGSTSSSAPATQAALPVLPVAILVTSAGATNGTGLLLGVATLPVSAPTLQDSLLFHSTYHVSSVPLNVDAASPALPVQPLSPASDLLRFRGHAAERSHLDDPETRPSQLLDMPHNLWMTMPPLHLGGTTSRPAQDAETLIVWDTALASLYAEPAVGEAVAQPSDQAAGAAGPWDTITPFESSLAAGAAIAAWFAWESRANGFGPRSGAGSDRKRRFPFPPSLN